MKKLFAVILLVCLGMTNVAFASGEINYSLNPNILSGTFEQEWSKGTVGKFHNHNVYVGMKVMLRLDKKSSANCTVGVGVRKFSGSTSTIVGYATMSFNKSNSSTSYKFYPVLRRPIPSMEIILLRPMLERMHMWQRAMARATWQDVMLLL